MGSSGTALPRARPSSHPTTLVKLAQLRQASAEGLPQRRGGRCTLRQRDRGPKGLEAVDAQQAQVVGVRADVLQNEWSEGIAYDRDREPLQGTAAHHRCQHAVILQATAARQI